MEKKVGEFVVSVGLPHPCWISIKIGRGEICFSHRELADLEYVVAAAKHAALLALPECYRVEIQA